MSRPLDARASGLPLFPVGVSRPSTRATPILRYRCWSTLRRCRTSESPHPRSWCSPGVLCLQVDSATTATLVGPGPRSGSSAFLGSRRPERHRKAPHVRDTRRALTTSTTIGTPRLMPSSGGHPNARGEKYNTAKPGGKRKSNSNADMSKLSEPLKALINAAHSKPHTLPAPRQIGAVYSRFADDAGKKKVGLSAWLTASVSLLSVYLPSWRI